MSELTEVCEKLGITAESKYGVSETQRRAWEKMDGKERPTTMNNYTVTLRFQGRKMTVGFRQGLGIIGAPKAADVLYCLASDARSGELDFHDFCGEFGYDEDSRSAEAVWKACAKTAPKLRKFLGDHFDDVANAEH